MMILTVVAENKDWDWKSIPEKILITNKFFSQLTKLFTDNNALDLTKTAGDRLYGSMNDHALGQGPLEFSMMGWFYCV
jgi:hypothetical protein